MTAASIDRAEAGARRVRHVAYDRAMRELAVRIHTFLPLITGGRA